MIGTQLSVELGVDGRLARWMRERGGAPAPGGEFEYGETAPGLLRNPRIPFDARMIETSDGARLHVREYGPPTAPRVLLIHGYGCRIEYWNPQINLLADRYRVVAYDQRGFGRSTLGDRPYDTDALGDDLSAVLSAVVPHRERITLVGHSLGGIAIMSWAARHPAEVTARAHAVVLADTVAENFSAHTKVVPLPASWLTLRRRLYARALGRLPIPAPPPTSGIFRRTALSVSASRSSTSFAAKTIASSPNPFRTRALDILIDLDVTAGLPNLRSTPVTVISGGLDRLTPPSATDNITSLLEQCGNHCRAVRFPNNGHCVNLEAPERFTAELERVLPAEGGGLAVG